jgi:membrane-bound lytic murein transglycosylase F
LQEIFADVPDTLERIKFVLAAYNAGENHVNDARRLAAKYGEDPNVWTDNVEEYMLRKADPEYYKDDAVRHGYSRGTEPVNYVREIFERYEDYRRLVDYDVPDHDDEPEPQEAGATVPDSS